jgi:hypothetical protein
MSGMLENMESGPNPPEDNKQSMTKIRQQI